MFANPYYSPPPHAQAVPPDTIFYLGGSECGFLSIMMYNSSTNLFTGAPLTTLPVISIAARNNRIMNVTLSVWKAAQQVPSGTWYQLTATPDGWGASNGALTDTLYEAADLAVYFAAMPSLSSVTSSPTAAPTGPPSPAATSSSQITLSNRHPPGLWSFLYDCGLLHARWERIRVCRQFPSETGHRDPEYKTKSHA